MPRSWTQLQPNDLREVLDNIAGQRDAVLFPKGTTQVFEKELPFYANIKLYRIVNYATLPVFSLMYLGQGNDMIQLNGTADPIYTANENGPVKIDETTVIPYLDFFFANVQGEDGDVYLIKSAQRMSSFDSLTAAQQKSLIENFRRLTVSRNGDNCMISGTVYYHGGLTKAAISVTPTGRINFLEQSLLLTGINFPNDFYSQDAWLEEQG